MTIVAIGRISQLMPVCSDSASVMVAVSVRVSFIHSISSDALAVAWARVRVVVFLDFIASCFLGQPLQFERCSL